MAGKEFKILLKRGRKAPKPADLEVGEVAINLRDMALMTKDERGHVVKLIGIVVGPHDNNLYGKVVGGSKLIPLGMVI